MFFHGNFALISPAGLLQLLCQERRSVLITAWCGESSVRVQLADGMIICARYDQIEGPEAIYRLLSWGYGQFQLEPSPAPPASRPLAGSWEELLLEAARRRDEQPSIGDTPRSAGPSRQQLIALLEVSPALAGIAAIGYDGRLLAEVELAPGLAPQAPALAGSLAVAAAALGGNPAISLYSSGGQQILLAEWGGQTLVLAIAAPGAQIGDAISQLSCWTPPRS